jgi:hypothetical protein
VVGVGPRKLPGEAAFECGSENASTTPVTASAAATSAARTSLIQTADAAGRRVRPNVAAGA